jgi:hypothetical protein
MTNTVPHPYTLEIIQLDRPAGHFGWALRRDGKLLERSDRAFTTEAKARESGMKAIEGQMSPSFDRR